MTTQESEIFLKKHLKKNSNIEIDFRNHRKHSLKGVNNIFRFTLDLMSMSFINSLAKDKKVRNVYWTPAHPPPGGSIDSISLRFKVYVEYQNEIN
jgi:hypothetical protein